MTRPEPDLSPGVPRKLDRYVTRLVAPNAGVMTGPGTNTYLVGVQHIAVIDPGPADAAHLEAILAAAKGLAAANGLAGDNGRIRWILCTHTHLDHAAAAMSLQRATGAKIAAMTKAATVPGMEHDARLVLDRPLAEGDAIEIDAGLSVVAVHTPGHASNHLCFLLPETGMLFTGDHVMQGSTVVIAPPDGNMRAYLQSLQRLRALEINTLAPGHGHLIHTPHAEAERLIEHRLARESKVRQALHEAGGSAPLAALLPHVYSDVPQTLHPLAARSLQAHLEKLIEDGDVRRVGENFTSRLSD
jgi:glyoxylase-like metal-dependent hydrolase (beta-lactamase superfamily II)